MGRRLTPILLISAHNSFLIQLPLTLGSYFTTVDCDANEGIPILISESAAESKCVLFKVSWQPDGEGFPPARPLFPGLFHYSNSSRINAIFHFSVSNLKKPQYSPTCL